MRPSGPMTYNKAMMHRDMCVEWDALMGDWHKGADTKCAEFVGDIV